MDNIKYVNHAIEHKLKIVLSQEKKEQLLIEATAATSTEEYFKKFLNIIGVADKSFVAAKVVSDGLFALQNTSQHQSWHYSLKTYCSIKRLDQTKVYAALKEGGYVFAKAPTDKALANSAFTSRIYEYDDEICYSYLWRATFLDSLLEKIPKSKKDKSCLPIVDMPIIRSTTVREIEKRVIEIYNLVDSKLSLRERQILKNVHFSFALHKTPLFLLRNYGDELGAGFQSIKLDISLALQHTDQLIKTNKLKIAKYSILKEDIEKLLNHYENKYA